MKELGKKRQENIETIEAYDFWGCSGLAVCDCEGEGGSYSNLNTGLYNYMRAKNMGWN